MKLIQQSAEIWEQPEGREGIYKQIERAARLCYKSEDKITDDSYKKFIEMISSKHHYSPFEHGTVYLLFTNESSMVYIDALTRYSKNPYSRIVIGGTMKGDNLLRVTTNYRVIKENGWENDLMYRCEPTEYHDKRISVHIITNRAISHELVRHRVFSFCQESQRYCNYSKDKFGDELTFITPNWVNPNPDVVKDYVNIMMTYQWKDSLEKAEHSYFTLLRGNLKPQEAREVLPNSTKTELIMTGFESDWEQFFKLRCSSAAHPMMQDLANKIRELMHKE